MQRTAHHGSIRLDTTRPAPSYDGPPARMPVWDAALVSARNPSGTPYVEALIAKVDALRDRDPSPPGLCKNGCGREVAARNGATGRPSEYCGETCRSAAKKARNVCCSEGCGRVPFRAGRCRRHYDEAGGRRKYVLGTGRPETRRLGRLGGAA